MSEQPVAGSVHALQTTQQLVPTPIHALPPRPARSITPILPLQMLEQPGADSVHALQTAQRPAARALHALNPAHHHGHR
jgi:hypothetical protein